MTNQERAATLKSAAAIIKRLTYCSTMLNKYAHRWCLTNRDGDQLDPSRRMQEWIDEYELLRESHRDVFVRYCNERGLDPLCNAYDCLA